MPRWKEYSERIASEIDEEVKLFLEKAHATAKQIIESRRDTVEALAALLLEKEVVDREEFLKLVDGKKGTATS